VHAEIVFSVLLILVKLSLSFCAFMKGKKNPFQSIIFPGYPWEGSSSIHFFLVSN
jgi:hypothetical protein